jgi:dolichol-phosphate mannosyltransferase
MISVVIPVYNNAQTLHRLTERLDAALGENPFEVIYVNDGSTDDSAVILRELAREHTFVRTILLSRNFGQHPAICAGFEHARGDRIVLMDADLDDEPENIPLLLDRLNHEPEIIYTVREDLDSRLSSYIYHYCFSRLAGISVPRGIGTFRAFSRKVLDAMLQYPEVNVLYGPLMFYIGFKHEFLTIRGNPRKRTKSAYTFSKRLLLAFNSLMSYTDFPYKISLYLGMIMMSLSGGYGIVVLVQYLLFGRSLPDGLTLILLYNSFMFGSILLILGILGFYLFKVFQESLQRPRYLIDEML